jgi:hypothetical protein
MLKVAPKYRETIYVVEDDFGQKLGRAFRETSSGLADRETTLNDLYSGEYHNPVRVIAFNVLEGWSRDVSHELAQEIQRRADMAGHELEGTVAEFVQYYTQPARQLTLRLIG